MLPIGVLIAKDIAALIINEQNECYGHFKQSNVISYSVNLWILVGCISHIATSVIIVFFALFALELNLTKAGDWRNYTRMREMHRWTVPIISALCCCGFFIVWDLMGFVLYHSMMDELNENESSFEQVQCKDLVLSWCILQSVETAIIPCFMFFYIQCFIGVSTWS